MKKEGREEEEARENVVGAKKSICDSIQEGNQRNSIRRDFIFFHACNLIHFLLFLKDTLSHHIFNYESHSMSVCTYPLVSLIILYYYPSFLNITPFSQITICTPIVCARATKCFFACNFCFFYLLHVKQSRFPREKQRKGCCMEASSCFSPLPPSSTPPA